jgi:hypothetical protein
MYSQLAVLVPTLLLLAGSWPRLDDVHVRGVVDPATHTVKATLTTGVRTPLGTVPVTGHARGTYRCDASFSGTIRYSPVLRVLARLRGATLVNTLQGHVQTATPWDCAGMADRFAAHLSFQDTLFTGQLIYNDTALPVSGVTALSGPRAFRSSLTARQSTHEYTVHVEFAER